VISNSIVWHHILAHVSCCRWWPCQRPPLVRCSTLGPS